MTPTQARRIFEEERQTFVRAGFDRATTVRLKITPKHFLECTVARDLAWYDPEDHTIYLVKRALLCSKAALQGVLRHELGHAVDPRIDDPGAEARADRLAEQATGQPMRYTKDDIQNARFGKIGRPSWLPKG